MAQAGFYHHPSANGDDRALCFSCNVCLVSWEPTDEPWWVCQRQTSILVSLFIFCLRQIVSPIGILFLFCYVFRSEHERHSPFCPFVRGEHTHNVPLSLSFATAPASRICRNGMGAPILGKSSCPAGVVIGYDQGLVVVWEIVKQAKVWSSDMISSSMTRFPLFCGDEFVN